MNSLLARKNFVQRIFSLPSDHIPYAEWTKEKISQSPYWEIVDQGFPFEHTSYFQDLLLPSINNKMQPITTINELVLITLFSKIEKMTEEDREPRYS